MKGEAVKAIQKVYWPQQGKASPQVSGMAPFCLETEITLRFVRETVIFSSAAYPGAGLPC